MSSTSQLTHLVLDTYSLLESRLRRLEYVLTGREWVPGLGTGVLSERDVPAEGGKDDEREGEGLGAEGEDRDRDCGEDVREEGEEGDGDGDGDQDGEVGSGKLKVPMTRTRTTPPPTTTRGMMAVRGDGEVPDFGNTKIVDRIAALEDAVQNLVALGGRGVGDAEGGLSMGPLVRMYLDHPEYFDPLRDEVQDGDGDEEEEGDGKQDGNAEVIQHQDQNQEQHWNLDGIQNEGGPESVAGKKTTATRASRKKKRTGRPDPATAANIVLAETNLPGSGTGLVDVDGASGVDSTAAAAVAGGASSSPSSQFFTVLSNLMLVKSAYENLPPLEPLLELVMLEHSRLGDTDSRGDGSASNAAVAVAKSSNGGGARDGAADGDGDGNGDGDGDGDIHIMTEIAAQEAEIRALRERTCVALKRWQDLHVVGIGQCWVEWEDRVKKVEGWVSRREKRLLDEAEMR